MSLDVRLATPEAREREVATILSRGILRWHASRNSATPESSAACLEVSPADRLSVPSGERSRESRPADVEHDAGED